VFRTAFFLAFNHGLEDLQDQLPEVLVLDLRGACWVDYLKQVLENRMHAHLTLTESLSYYCEDARLRQLY